MEHLGINNNFTFVGPGTVSPIPMSELNSSPKKISKVDEKLYKLYDKKLYERTKNKYLTFVELQKIRSEVRKEVFGN